MKPKTKEKSDIEMLCSWMEMGGLPARPENKAWGLLLEVSFYFLPLSFYVAFYYLLFFIYYPCTFLHLLGAGLVEESGHSSRRGPEVRGQSSAPGVLWARKDGRRWWQDQRWKVSMGS